MASLRLGLRCGLEKASPLAMTTAMVARRAVLLPHAHRGAPPCFGPVPSTKRFAGGGSGPSPTVQRKMQERGMRFTPDMINAPLPGSLIPPPISQWPRGRAFLRFAFDVWKGKGRAWLQGFLLSLSSRPKPWKPARLKLDNSAIPPMAKEIYTDMMQAIAAGDGDKLVRELCTQSYATPLLASIQNRPRTRRFKWELVKWTGKVRIASQVVTAMGTGRSDMLRQVTVHLPSRQRRIEYALNKETRKWDVASEKEADVDEYLILISIISAGTYQKSEWRVLATTRPSTVKEWENEKKILEEIQQAEMEEYKL